MWVEAPAYSPANFLDHQARTRAVAQRDILSTARFVRVRKRLVLRRGCDPVRTSEVYMRRLYLRMEIPRPVVRLISLCLLASSPPLFSAAPGAPLPWRDILEEGGRFPARQRSKYSTTAGWASPFPRSVASRRFAPDYSGIAILLRTVYCFLCVSQVLYCGQHSSEVHEF
jgi:hypothetical protein